MAPKSFFTDRYVLAALLGHDVDLKDDVLFPHESKFSLHVGIADDLEQKPLLLGQSPARSIFLLSELLDRIGEGLMVLGLVHPLISTDPRHNDLTLRFSIPARNGIHASVGGAMCLATLLDALFFERGLKMASLRLEIREQESVMDESAFALLKGIFAGYLHGCL